jgi:hypothetical protein
MRLIDRMIIEEGLRHIIAKKHFSNSIAPERSQGESLVIYKFIRLLRYPQKWKKEQILPRTVSFVSIESLEKHIILNFGEFDGRLV